MKDYLALRRSSGLPSTAAELKLEGLLSADNPTFSEVCPSLRGQFLSHFSALCAPAHIHHSVCTRHCALCLKSLEHINPLMAGALYAWGVVLTPAVGAALMAASTVIVAINARMLTLKKSTTDKK